MLTHILLTTSTLALLASAQTTIPPPTTLQKRYTPPSGESCTFLCKDYFDDCGNTYGPGCFTSCPQSPDPTYSTPICNPATTSAALEKRFTPPPGETGTTVCREYFDDCGNTYGPGCYLSYTHSPEPTYTTPVCNVASTTPAPTSTELVKRFSPPPGETGTTVCREYFDDCGNTYGPGCYLSYTHSPEPTFTTPVCNVATSTAV